MAEWRNDVRPMLWRCKWLVLHVMQEKELQRAISKNRMKEEEAMKILAWREERGKDMKTPWTLHSTSIKNKYILSYFFGPLSIYFPSKKARAKLKSYLGLIVVLGCEWLRRR